MIPLMGVDAQTLRGAVLGCLDGLTTALALISGLHASGVSSNTVVLSSIVAAVSGSLSMGFNEVVSMNSYNNHVETEATTSPWKVGAASAIFFLLGSVVPIVAYLPDNSIILVIMMGAFALFFLGAFSVREPDLRLGAGLRALALGGSATAITFALGWLIGGVW